MLNVRSTMTETQQTNKGKRPSLDKRLFGEGEVVVNLACDLNSAYVMVDNY